MTISAYIIDELLKQNRERDLQIQDERRIELPLSKFPEEKTITEEEPSSCGVEIVDFFI